MERNWKAEAVKQWDADPCGADREAAFGTAEFFALVERERYERYAPWMKSALGFERFAGKTVLEVGFGLGTDHMAFARSGARCYGVDLTPAHVDATRRRLRLENLPVRIARGDAEVLPFADSSFDAVYSFGVLHHTPDTGSAVEEVRRVLRPGGEAIVGLYHSHSLFFSYLMMNRGILRGGLVTQGYRRTVSQIERREHSDAVPLVKLYSRRSVRRLFRDFADVSIESQHFYWDDLGGVGRGIRGMLGRFAEPVRERLASRFGWYLIVRARRPT